MSKERAVRRAARLADAERERSARDRARARKAKRRAVLRAVTPKLPDRRTGRLYPRRSYAQRVAIVLTAMLVLWFIWWYLDDLSTRFALTIVVLFAAPALIVLTLDRRT